MSRLQALHPDQQAVLQLVLRRRMPYGDLAGLLGLTTEGVRERALDAIDGLAPDDVPGLQLEDRDRIADHLLGQDEGADREATAALLADHPPALQWASTVAAELEPLGGPIAALPGTPGTAGDVAPAPVAVPESAPTPVAAAAGPASGPAAGGAPSAASATRAGSARTTSPIGSRSPRVLAGSAAAVVVLVLLIVWIAGGFSGGDDEGDSSASAPAAATSTAADGTSTDDATAAAQANAARFVAALPQTITFRPPSSATGALAKVTGAARPTVSSQDATAPVLALAIRNLPASTSKRRYFVWADKNGADPIFLGELPSVTGAAILFQGIDLKTRQAAAVDPSVYTTMRVTLETNQRPTKPGPTVLVGRISPRS